MGIEPSRGLFCQRATSTGGAEIPGRVVGGGREGWHQGSQVPQLTTGLPIASGRGG